MQSAAGDRRSASLLRAPSLNLPALTLSTQLTLRDALSLGWWWPGNQRYEPSQVLSDGGKKKLILSSSWTTQSKAAELQNAQVPEPHLDLLALTSRLLKSFGAANDRATSRACLWMSRGNLRDGSFGQHCSLSGQTSQSSLLARYRSIFPSCTVPLVRSRFPPGHW